MKENENFKGSFILNRNTKYNTLDCPKGIMLQELLSHIVYLVFFVFWVFLRSGLELRAYTLSLSTSPFCEGFFQDRVLQTICLGWL
jgi:hypothetical protein